MRKKIFVFLMLFTASISVSAHYLFKPLHFRNLGPAAAGGRITAVVGISGNQNIIYVGSAAGGIFKSVNGGETWKAIFKKESTGSIGAMAVLPTTPTQIWVGTGEANLRNDISPGKGVYFSPDGGKHWKFKGLRQAGQIASILVNPFNPKEVFVGAVGDAWGPNSERGVFRTTNGGKTWKKVLFLNNKTGCADLVMDPKNPKILFAAMWEVVRHPWALEDGGKWSGIYRSIDGGKTWKKLTKGLPKGPLGRIALADAPSNPEHVYALIEAKKGMLWDSTDLGGHWHLISSDHALDERPFYFSRFEVSPQNQNELYFLSVFLLKSNNGGKTVYYGPKFKFWQLHPDQHAIWIDPKDPQRIIIGNDGGVYMTDNNGSSWKFLDHLPVEEFYQISVTEQHPFMICGGIQDNGSWCGPSRNLVVSGVQNSNWVTVSGGDGQYVLPSPNHPDIVYAEDQNGYIKRVNLKTKVETVLQPYIPTNGDMLPSLLKYRFNWTSPLAIAPTDPATLYLGANALFKSQNKGFTWKAISPDLTRNDKKKQIKSGGKVEYDMSGAENYDTITSISVSPLDSKVIWVGSDDGLIHVTQDGGKKWINVTSNIPHLPQWGKIQVEASSFSASSCYITVDFHKMNNDKPYVYKTKNLGRTWTKISRGLPEDNAVHVVREDPNQRGLLVLGTETSLYYSLNDGKTWKKFKNFPTVPVYDIKFQKLDHDLVVGTHGRGIFILDDITPIEDWDSRIKNSSLYFFKPLPAYLYPPSSVVSVGHPQKPGGFMAPNPPDGVILDYYVRTQKKTVPVTILIRDEKGEMVAKLHKKAKNGLNRMIWNFRYQAPVKLKPLGKIIKILPPSFQQRFFPRGPLVVPGKYKITIAISPKNHGKLSHKSERKTMRKTKIMGAARAASETRTAVIKLDPAFHFNLQAFQSKTREALKMRNAYSALNEVLNKIYSLKTQIQVIQGLLKTHQAGNIIVRQNSSSQQNLSQHQILLEKLKRISSHLTSFSNHLYDPKIQRLAAEEGLHHLTRLNAQLGWGMYLVNSYFDKPVTPAVQAYANQKMDELKNDIVKFNLLIKREISPYNKEALKTGTPILFSGHPVLDKF